jgi:hypothetical protein
MKVGRGTEIDDIDVGALNCCLELGEKFWDCVLFGEGCPAL